MGEYGPPLKDAIWALKFTGRQQVGLPLGHLLARTWQAWGVPIDAIVVVPMSPTRLSERRYNPAEIIARPCARRLGVPLWRDVVQRTRLAPPQRGLGADARRQNVRGLFAATPHVRGQRVLIVDDVTTTGATMGAMAEALTQAGARAVWGLALASPRMGY